MGRMAFSRSFVLVALLVALIALLCAPQPTEARFFGFRRRFRCGRRFAKFLFKRAARFGDGEDFCLNTLNGVEYDITSGVGESRCRVVCRGIPSPSRCPPPPPLSRAPRILVSVRHET